MKGEMDVSQDNYKVEIDEDWRKELSQTGFVSSGTYKYIGMDVFFKEFQTVPAKDEQSTLFMLSNVATFRDIFPSNAEHVDPTVMRTVTLSLQLTVHEFEVVKDAVDGKQCDPQEVVDNLRRAEQVDAVELTFTKGLSSHLSKILGNEFSISSNQAIAILGKNNPVCKYATCHPDLTLYHEEKFVFKDMIAGASFLDNEMTSPPASPGDASTSPTEYTLIGSGGEDKLAGQSGEKQAIIAMIIVATFLGVKAIHKKCLFNRAVVFGHVRVEGSDGMVTPYKMDMNFITRENTIKKGKPIHAVTYLKNVRYYLKNPQLVNQSA